MAADRKKTEEEDLEFITLEFDDGVVMETEVMGIFEFEDNEYIALIPDDGSDEVYIYSYEEDPLDEDDFDIDEIKDDDEFERVVAAFEELMGWTS